MNKAEQNWMKAVSEQPCSINNDDCGGGVQVHHITSGGRRLGHLYTIPLCVNHHGPQTPLKHGHAVHKGKKTFENIYGSQMSHLIALQGRLLGAE